jgi:hypothetical protein
MVQWYFPLSFPCPSLTPKDDQSILKYLEQKLSLNIPRRRWRSRKVLITTTSAARWRRRRRRRRRREQQRRRLLFPADANRGRTSATGDVERRRLEHDRNLIERTFSFRKKNLSQCDCQLRLKRAFQRNPKCDQNQIYNFLLKFFVVFSRFCWNKDETKLKPFQTFWRKKFFFCKLFYFDWMTRQ